LRVAAHASVVGGPAPGSSSDAADAQTAVDEKARAFVEGLGWVLVGDSASHDLTMELSFSVHVKFIDIGGETAIVLPPAQGPSLRLSAGGVEVLSVPASARSLRCKVTGRLGQRRNTCARWVIRAADARLVAAMNGSEALADVARRAHP